MKEKLYLKIEKELQDFKDEVKEKGVDYAIDRAYELTAKQEIIEVIEYDLNLSKTEIKALLSRDCLLDELYQDWLDFDGHMRESINYCVNDSISMIVSDCNNCKADINEYER